MPLFGRKRRRTETSPYPPAPPVPLNQGPAVAPGPVPFLPYGTPPAAYYSTCDLPATSSQSTYRVPPTQSQSPSGYGPVPVAPAPSPNFLCPDTSNNIASAPHLSVPTPQTPPPPARACGSSRSQWQRRLRGPKWQSCVDLPVAQTVGMPGHDGIDAVREAGTDGGKEGTGVYDAVSRKLDEVITSMDGGVFRGGEKELAVTCTQPSLREEDGRDVERSIRPDPARRSTSTNYFSKVYLYANSRFPPDLPPLRVHLSTYPLLCLAAQYSRRVYDTPTGAERAFHVDPDWRTGTKAMVIRSVPIDDMDTIVFAIRGTQSFRDWTVNVHTEPTSPEGFLDDPGNLCHAGFLSVARRMVHPVAERLRSLLREDPNHASSALLITGHSAGGAVASLLYSHMLSDTVHSELTHLRGFFRRVHCVTFGAPPVSLLPLQKQPSPAYRKSIFLSVINEGDPVPRADKAYVRSLLELYVAPAPGSSSSSSSSPLGPLESLLGSYVNRWVYDRYKDNRRRKHARPTWKLPPSTLSAAGRLVVLRTPASASRRRRSFHPRTHPTYSSLAPTEEREAEEEEEEEEEEIEACTTTDEELRGLVFGDPLMHAMDLYARRIEILARNAMRGM